MNMRSDIAQASSALSTWALRRVFHRPAENFPGKMGLFIDPHLIADLKPRLREGSIMVVGTNGKTTVTNILADAFEAAGKTVACNRTGANLDSGLATSLLHAGQVDWGVFESDELWLAKTLPELQSRFVLLLNLFRDQLDRMGEIDHIQTAIAQALAASPETTLLYNTDDPLCQAIADQVPNECISFGFDAKLGLALNTVADASMCQHCDAILEYRWRQYGQLGLYRCSQCGFAREQPLYSAEDVTLSPDGATFTVSHSGTETIVNSPFAEPYMLYNALAVYAAADCCGLEPCNVEAALTTFDPQNGRLQHYDIAGSRVLLNLAKNPTGFNQNLRLIMDQPGPKAVAFFINDNEADGHDVSWLWDVDFQELAAESELLAFAGGIRRNDMQVRLKHAGIKSDLVESAEDFMAKASCATPKASLFLIANYTALPRVKADLDLMQHKVSENRATPAALPPVANEHDRYLPEGPKTHGVKLTIVHLYPELLNLYGDGGNVTVLENRARWRGLDVEVIRVGHGESADLKNADIVFLGGGPDREQRLASRDLFAQAQALSEYVEDDGVLLAICGGYQILGREWIAGGESVAGLSVLDIVTKRADGDSHNRLVGNIALKSPLAHMPVIGYENHAGRTYLGEGHKPFGHVIGKHGKGNNDVDKSDGVLYRNVVGTYLHGPVLSKNPEIADWLIKQALARRAAKQGRKAPDLLPIDDAIEQAANAYMQQRLNVH